jgi:hypothetical protein
MGLFAAVIVVVFSFAFVRNQAALIEAVPGVAWAAVVFAGTIGLGRAFDREREGDTMRALLLAPAPRLAVFAGKAIAVALLVFAVEAVALPLCLLFFNVDLGAAVGHLALVLVLGGIGFAVVGTVFARHAVADPGSRRVAAGRPVPHLGAHDHGRHQGHRGAPVRQHRRRLVLDQVPRRLRRRVHPGRDLELRGPGDRVRSP